MIGLLIFVVLLAVFIAFTIADTHAYLQTRWPDREFSWMYAFLPGGGFVARHRFGKWMTEEVGRAVRQCRAVERRTCKGKTPMELDRSR